MGASPNATLDPWNDRLTLLLESTGEGIFGIDLQGCCIFINAAGARMLGYAVADVLGRNMHDLIHHAHPDGSAYPVEECPIFHAFRQGRPCRLDSEVLWRADGSSFPAEYSSHPIMEGGNVLGAVVTFVDISERRRADALLRAAKDELERRVAERTQALSEALTELRALSGHMHGVREEERRRIAREIHDELGSVLVALKLDLGWLRGELKTRPELVAKTMTMAGSVDKAVAELGRIITALRPSILDHQGLWAALEWQAQEFLEATGLRGALRLDIAPDAPVPHDVLATAAYRIFQEILSNVARHADATAVEMQVSADAAELVMTVRDNGRGVTLKQLRGAHSHGILGITERARHFGGRLEIGPGAKGGTLVRVRLPLASQEVRA